MTTRNELSSVYNNTHCENTDNYMSYTNKRLLKDATMVPHMGTITSTIYSWFPMLPSGGSYALKNQIHAYIKQTPLHCVIKARTMHSLT